MLAEGPPVPDCRSPSSPAHPTLLWGVVQPAPDNFSRQLAGWVGDLEGSFSTPTLN